MAKKAEEKKVEVETKKTTTKKVVKKEVVKKTPVKKVAAKKEVEEIKVEAVVEEKKVEKEVKPQVGVTVEQLFEAGAHFGHVVKKWNPKMKKYLWGEKNGVHIFDLEITLSKLAEATKEINQAASSGKRIVVVGTKRQVKPMIEEMAKRIGVSYLSQRWMGGLITNWKQVRQTIERLVSLRSKRDSGQLKKYTKKEQVLFDKEIARLERVVGGLVNLRDVPEMVIVFDTHKERLAVKEAKSRGVKVVGLVDSNSNPDMVDFIIPMNDDSVKGLEIVVKEVETALSLGLKDIKK